jgi:chromosome segregation ATPase
LAAVGMLALIVAGISGGAFLQGRFKDASTRAVVKKDIELDEKTMEHFRLQIDRVQSDLDKSQDLVTTHKEWEQLAGELRKSRPRATELSNQKATLEEEVAALSKEFNDYRTKYLRQIRNAAAGEKLDELSSREGKVYRGVTIKRVTDTGLEFTHASGLATLKPEELAESWRERFQW